MGKIFYDIHCCGSARLPRIADVVRRKDCLIRRWPKYLLYNEGRVPLKRKQFPYFVTEFASKSLPHNKYMAKPLVQGMAARKFKAKGGILLCLQYVYYGLLLFLIIYISWRRLFTAIFVS